jgi:hypothetical protein
LLHGRTGSHIDMLRFGMNDCSHGNPFLNSYPIIVSGQRPDKRFLITEPIMHRQYAQSANQNGAAESITSAGDRYCSRSINPSKDNFLQDRRKL